MRRSHGGYRTERWGVKDIHAMAVAGQIVTDIGRSAAKTEMLASSRIVATVAATWRRSIVRSSSTRHAHPCGDRCWHRLPTFASPGQLFPLATLTPSLDEARLPVDIEVDAEVAADARGQSPACAGATR